MIDTVRTMWLKTPIDARCVLFTAFAMPVLMMAYQLGWSQIVSRSIFNASITFIVFLLASQIKVKAVDAGWLLERFSFALCLISFLAVSDTLWWRIVTGANQAVMVVAWFALWANRNRWLSRTVALRAGLVAAAGLVLYVTSNFVLDDPLRISGEWGQELARGVIGRTMRQPLVEMVLPLVLYVITFAPWYKYLHRKGVV